MRTITAAAFLALSAAITAAPARADTVPPVTGNDTGGIIASWMIGRADIRAIAIDHCARYGKVVKFLGAQRHYGGYVSFACRWVPYHRAAPTLRTRY